MRTPSSTAVGIHLRQPSTGRLIGQFDCMYYALNNKLPVNVFLCKSYAYSTNFGALQEIYSCQPSPGFFYFRGAPDLIFTTKKSSAAMHVWDEEDTVKAQHS